MNDPINPPHYQAGGAYEHVRVVNAWGLSYQLGCATKYLCRAGKKDPDLVVQDLRKAIKYIEMEIDRLDVCSLCGGSGIVGVGFCACPTGIRKEALLKNDDTPPARVLHP